MQHFLLGFLVKTFASLDDTFARIPVVAAITNTRVGKIAFSLGNLLAVSAILIFAIFFSFLIKPVGFVHYLAAGLIFLMAAGVYKANFISHSEQRFSRRFFRLKTVSVERVAQLVGIGFVVSGITLLDDLIVLIPLFIDNPGFKLELALGVYTATLLEIVAIIFFAERLHKIKYKREIATVVLIILGFLVLFRVV